MLKLSDSYRVLQLPYGAEMPEIRQAYRRLALQYHPDRNPQPEAHALFLQVQAAYEYLQRFHTLASILPETLAAESLKTQEELEWERYQHVYHAPTDPQEYEAWARVAIKRARLQDEKDQAAFVQRTLAFKKKWWYWPAWVSSYLVIVFGVLVGVWILALPVYFWWSEQTHYILISVLVAPLSIRVFQMMKSLRQDMRKHFGEDLEEPAK